MKWPEPAANGGGNETMSGSRIRTGCAVVAVWAMLWALPGFPLPAANAVTRPSGRSAAAMTYDGASKTVVLFGGNAEFGDRGGELNDTWVWNGTAWKQRTPPASPPAREHAAMAYDGNTKTVVLFGGTSDNCGVLFDDTCVKLNDTWIWNGVARTWRQVLTPVSPPARSDASMAYDKVSRKVLLFGGSNSSNTYLNDTWSWDGDAEMWTPLSPSESPSARRWTALAPDGGGLVLFSGSIMLGAAADTWTWDSAASNWVEEAPPESPPAREGATMAYDKGRGRAVIFGGAPSTCCNQLTDTWTWNGANKSWALAATTGPGARFFHSMAYDAARQRVVVFGGQTPTSGMQNDTWVWNGTSWKLKP